MNKNSTEKNIWLFDLHVFVFILVTGIWRYESFLDRIWMARKPWVTTVQGNITSIYATFFVID